MLTCDLQDKMLLACYHNISILKLTVSFIVFGLGYFKSISQHSTNEMLETYEVNIIGFNLLLHAAIFIQTCEYCRDFESSGIHHTSKCGLLWCI